jgi:DNA polymerase-1
MSIAMADHPDANLTDFQARMQARCGDTWKSTEGGAIGLGKKAIKRMVPVLLEPFPIIADYLKVRAVWNAKSSLLTNYGVPLRRWIDADGRMRGQLDTAGAVTTRHKAHDPNAQNIPRDREFRALFKAPNGRVLIDCDYSQIELRLGAIVSPDEALLEVYRDPSRDVHEEVAAVCDGMTIVEFKTLPGAASKSGVWKTRRDARKGCGFSMIYGSGVQGLAETIGCALAEAREVMERFLTAYPGIHAYRERAPREAQERGYIEIRPGRRVRYDPLLSRGPQAINYQIQGGAASVQIRALRLIYDALAVRPDLETQLAASVHDEVLLEAPDDERAGIAAGILQDCMRNALLDVFPEAAEQGADQLAEAKVCHSWSEK